MAQSLQDYPQEYWLLLARIKEHGEYGVEFDTVGQAQSIRFRLYKFFTLVKKMGTAEQAGLVRRIRVKIRGASLLLVLGDKTMEETRMFSALLSQGDMPQVGRIIVDREEATKEAIEGYVPIWKKLGMTFGEWEEKGKPEK